MSEIKYRGKRIDNGEWIYGNYVLNNLYSKSIHHWIYSIYLNEGDICEIMHRDDVHPETVGQYTGLKDKNGTELYEGDVIETYNQKNIVTWKEGQFRIIGLHPDICERNYDSISYYLVYGTLRDIDGSGFNGVTTTLEKIGNIHENTELLESEVDSAD